MTTTLPAVQCEWLGVPNPSQVPKGADCQLQLQSIRRSLTPVYEEINRLATYKDGEYYTDHGIEHVDTVAERAIALTNSRQNGTQTILTPYETFILLAAIHVHDAAMAFGRLEHIKKLPEVTADLITHCSDSTEWHAIGRIAHAHAAEDGDQDTISTLPSEEGVLGIPIRTQMLAAILRLADELADDYKRAARFLVDRDAVPLENEVYHYYAKYLQPPTIHLPLHEIRLHFSLYDETASKRLGKGKKKLYLLDYIYERTIKLHLERAYCMRFMSPLPSLDKIKVMIDLFRDEPSFAPWRTIPYVLQETGYPSASKAGIYDMCKNDLLDGETKKNGKWLAKVIAEPRR